MEIDWPSVAHELLRRLERPAVLLDHEGRVRAANDLFRGMIGRSDPIPEGLPWEELADAPASEALRGAGQRSSEMEARLGLPSGGEVMALLSASTVASHGEACTLLQVVYAYRRSDRRSSRPSPGSRTYVVRAIGAERGVVIRADGPDGPIAAVPGRVCHRALHGRDTPCDGCPVFEETANRARTFVPDEGGRGIRVADFVFSPEGDEASVTVSHVEMSALSALVDARIEALGRHGGLVDREREVLSLLFLGRSAGEMALLLRVSERTAKYQQALVLKKVGAASRTDLVRLLLRGPSSRHPPERS